MRFKFFVICVILLHLNSVLCLSADNDLRIKRSNPGTNETEGLTFKKVKDGVKHFGSKVSHVATKGYEEFKNLFSRERKVGDYQINNLDVRVQQEEDDYEEVAVKKRPKRSKKLTENDEMSIDFVVDLDKISKKIKGFHTIESN